VTPAAVVAVVPVVTVVAVVAMVTVVAVMPVVAVVAGAVSAPVQFPSDDGEQELFEEATHAIHGR